MFRNFVIQECPDINNAVAKVIEISEDYKEHFLHISGLIDEIREGDEVEFDLQEGKKD